MSLLTAGVGFGGLGLAGHAVNHIDLAPRFAGVLMGISNCVGTVPGIIGPVVAKAIAHSVSVFIRYSLYGHIPIISGVICQAYTMVTQKYANLISLLSSGRQSNYCLL